MGLQLPLRGPDAQGRILRLTPAQGGVPYYLVDDEGKGTWARRDTIGPNVRPPMWVIKSW